MSKNNDCVEVFALSWISDEYNEVSRCIDAKFDIKNQ